MIFKRRDLLRVAIVAAIVPAGRRAFGKSANDLAGNDSKPPAHPLPADLSLSDVPGIIWAGSAKPDVTIVEFFDYNCPFCRRAAGDLDKMIAGDMRLRFGLINNAILGIGSVQAAKVQQAVLKLYGPARTYDFHRALFAHHGAVDGPVALDIATDLKMDAAAIEAAGDSDAIGAILIGQAKLAQRLDLAMTPSFILNDEGISGYPGARATRGMITALRECGKLAC